MVGRIVRQFEHPDHLPADAHAHRAGGRPLVRHGIGIAVQARVVRPPATHEVAFLLAGAFSVLAEKLLGRNLGPEARHLDVTDLQAVRPGDLVFEVPGTGAIDLQPVKDVPLLDGPLGLDKTPRVDADKLDRAPPLLPRLFSRLTTVAHGKRGEVPAEHGAGSVFELYGEDHDGRFIGHGHRKRLEGAALPRTVRDVAPDATENALPSQAVPSAQHASERQCIAGFAVRHTGQV